jgi:glucose/arabinose dehydrogenase
MKKAIGIIIILILMALAWLAFGRPGTPEPPVTMSPETEVNLENTEAEVVTGLEVPWAIAFITDEEMLVTERPGRLLRVSLKGEKEVVSEIDEVLDRGEGGLLGVAVHPDFETNKLIYVYYTYAEDGANTLNRVVRYGYVDGNLSEPTVIVDRIPGAATHNGGRIAFGPDGYLYIGTGDAQAPSLSQDTSSLAGKILRVNDNGELATGNPFENEVYSYGHRNVQGLAWDDQGRLWATEHGPRGNDELNVIEAGANYGWPVIQGDQAREGMRTPVVHSGSATWAPSGLAYAQGRLFFAGLRGQALYRYDIEQNRVEALFTREFGRLRDVVVHNDRLFVTTSNRDGRGQPQADDDQIIPMILEPLF